MSGELVNLGELAGHVSDGAEYHLPEFLGGRLDLPSICGSQITKFMTVEVVVALLMVALFVPLAGKISDLSPIGSALIDMRVGDEKEIETPSGLLRIKVMEVSRTQG